ncbi:MAG: hypothetical protein ACI4BI_04830 [Anaerotardibacter sp.]
MRKSIFSAFLLLAFVILGSSFQHYEEPTLPSATQGNKIGITTNGNGDIASASPMNVQGTWAWRIRDLSGMTNIRNNPKGKVCMKLKAWTQYTIYTGDYTVEGWLNIQSIYNETEGYWVRLHSSSTGNYWIARSILYKTK